MRTRHRIWRILKTILSLTVIFLLGLFCLVFYASLPLSSESDLQIDSIHTLSFPTKDFKDPQIKFVTYNIGYASGEKNNTIRKLSKNEVIQNLRLVAETLKTIDADIIALQEVDFDARRTHNINQWEFLANELKMPFAATAITWNKKYVAWPYWPISSQFGPILSGQAVLSRYPITKQDIFPYEKPEDNPFWYNWFYLDRVVQKLNIQVGQKNIIVWNLHLEAFSPVTRFHQVDLLAGWVSGEKNENQILLGDFNSISVVKKNLDQNALTDMVEKGDALKIFLYKTGFSNAERVSDEAVLSMPSWDPVKKIDHILYGPAFIFLDFGSENSLASDHLPIWARFDIRP